jgi:alpha-N-arabinofuranosidase
MKTPADNQPILIASGGSDEQTHWVEELMQIKPEWSYRLDAISHHHYTIATGNWDKKGNALGFPEEEWVSTMYRTLRIEEYLKSNLKIMDKYDPEQKVGFYVDEWGTWYDVSEGNPGFLYQQNSLRDGLVAALNLNIFHKYSKRIHMTNIAQMINVLQAMILTDKEKMVLTPTYHVFKMYIPFQDSTHIPLTIKGSKKYKFEGNSITNISASSAIAKDGGLYVAIANSNVKDAETVIIKTGDSLSQAQGSILTHEKMDAHNSFDNPNEIKPQAFSATASGGEIKFEMPAKSVVVLKLN